VTDSDQPLGQVQPKYCRSNLAATFRNTNVAQSDLQLH
jgi:hypothetical protein